MRALLIVFVLQMVVSLESFADEQRKFQLNDSVELVLTKTDFDPDNREIHYSDPINKVISSIDGQPVFGTDATLPNSELTRAEIRIGDRTIELQTTGMYDPWFGPDQSVAMKIEPAVGNSFKLKCLLSIGAGMYLVEWTIIGDSSYLTILSNEMSIMDAVDF